MQVSEYRFVDRRRRSTTSCPNGLCPLGTTNLAHPDRRSRTPSATPSRARTRARRTRPSTSRPTARTTSPGTRRRTPALAHIAPERHPPADLLDPHPRRTTSRTSPTRRPVLSRRRGHQRHRHRRHRLGPLRADRPDCIRRGAQDRPRRDRRRASTSTSRAPARRPSARRSSSRSPRTYPASGDCNDLAAADYGKTVPVVRPRRPGLLEAAPRLPDEARHHQPGRLRHPARRDRLRRPARGRRPSNNTVPIGAIDTSTPPAGSAGRSAAANDVDDGGKVFEVTFKTTVGSPLGHDSGDVEGNLHEVLLREHAGHGVHAARPDRLRAEDPRAGAPQGRPAGQQRHGQRAERRPQAGRRRRPGRVPRRRHQQRHGRLRGRPASGTCSRPGSPAPTSLAISDGGTCVAGKIKWTGIDVAQRHDQDPDLQGDSPRRRQPRRRRFTNTAGVVEYSYVGNDRHALPAGAGQPHRQGLDPDAEHAAAEDPSRIFTAASVGRQDPDDVGHRDRQRGLERGDDRRDDRLHGHHDDPEGHHAVRHPDGRRPARQPARHWCRAACARPRAPRRRDAADRRRVRGRVAGATRSRRRSPRRTPTPTGHDVTLVLHFRATVLDVAANVRGSTLPNTATLDLQGPGARHEDRAAAPSPRDRRAEDRARQVAHPGRPGVPEPAGRLHAHGVERRGRRTSRPPTTSSWSTRCPSAPTQSTSAATRSPTAAPSPVDGGIWNATARTITWTKAATPGPGARSTRAGPGQLTYQVRLQHAPVGGSVVHQQRRRDDDQPRRHRPRHPHLDVGQLHRPGLQGARERHRLGRAPVRLQGRLAGPDHDRQPGDLARARHRADPGDLLRRHRRGHRARRLRRRRLRHDDVRQRVPGWRPGARRHPGHFRCCRQPDRRVVPRRPHVHPERPGLRPGPARPPAEHLPQRRGAGARRSEPDQLGHDQDEPYRQGHDQPGRRPDDVRRHRRAGHRDQPRQGAEARDHQGGQQGPDRQTR